MLEKNQTVLVIDGHHAGRDAVTGKYSSKGNGSEWIFVWFLGANSEGALLHVSMIASL